MSATASPAAARADLQRRLPPMVAGLAIIGPFAIDTYLPAFGSMARELNATPLQVQQTLTAYLLPFAVMALWHGAVSDALGRRSVVLVGLALFALAAVGAALASSIEALWFWRALQGAVAGVGMTVGRAVVRDVADGVEAQRMLAQSTQWFVIAPALAPIIGGWIDAAVGWRGVFVFLALLAVALMAVCWRLLPETLPVSQRVSLRPAPMLAAYRGLATQPAFLRLAAVLALNFCGFFVYVLAAPVYLPAVLGLAPTAFAWLFVPAVSGTLVGAWLSSRFAGRLAPRRTVWLGLAIMAVASSLSLAQALLMDPYRVPWATLPLFVYNVGMAFAMAPLQVMLLDTFAARRGMASSGMAFTQSLGNSLVASLIAPLLWHAATPMAAGAAVCVLAAALIFAWHVRALPLSTVETPS